METKHTPGPWATIGASIVNAENRNTVAFAVERDGDSATQDANARLIAAAPELLKELDRLLSAVMQNSDADQTELGLKPFIRPALAAIAKATGA
ncbi:hypothetical protein [Microvirgula aerodenitrificans]|uniref:hypothetical protein n=1 Tax=Microvirgula aerodenitrificans TaxID=57480 RepID=UPI00248D963A|nr:hypothetical protein [Microvirgula aerodenitrificans]